MNADHRGTSTLGGPLGVGQPSAAGDGVNGESAIPPWFISHLNGGESLTPELDAVIQDVITPLYGKLVLEESDPLLRAAGITVVAAHTLTLLEQPAVLEASSRACAGDDEARAAYERIVARYLKTARESSRTMNLHLALRRARYAAWVVPSGPDGILRKHGVGI